TRLSRSGRAGDILDTARHDVSVTRMGSAAQVGPPVAAFSDAQGAIRIGRDAGNDVVLPDLWVSGKHVEIRRSGDGYQLVDLGSPNGVHHNGRRVQRGDLRPGDRFTVGRHEFLFDGKSLFHHDDIGPTSFVADDITVDIGKANLLDDVSFALRQG